MSTKNKSSDSKELKEVKLTSRTCFVMILGNIYVVLGANTKEVKSELTITKRGTSTRNKSKLTNQVANEGMY